MDKFHAIYGDGYIFGIVRGGYYYGLVEVSCETLHEKREITSELQSLSHMVACRVSGGISGSTILASELVKKRSRLSVVRSGGFLGTSARTLDEMLVELGEFPEQVARSPAVPYALYRAYDDIPPFSELKHNQIEERKRHARCLEYLETIYLRYKDYYTTIQGFLDSDPSSFLISEPEYAETTRTALREDISGIDAQLKKLSEFISTCDGTTDSFVGPETLYQLSPVTQQLIDAYSSTLSQSSSANMNVYRHGRLNGDQISPHEELDDKLVYNAAVIGFTGVGKSSLINYLFGEQVSKTGIGSPVTSRGFHSFRFLIGSLPVCIFDSWGLEVDKAVEWLESLKKELSLRGTDRPAEEWFHTILYCVNAASSRIQDAEIDIIKRLVKSKYTVVILLTKADLIGEHEEDIFCNAIKERVGKNIRVIPVCSETREGRRGQKVVAFGREKVVEQIFDNFWHSITDRLPERCAKLLKEYLTTWKDEQVANIVKRDREGQSIDTIKKSIVDSLSEDKLRRLAIEEIVRTIGIYSRIVSGMELNDHAESSQEIELAIDRSVLKVTETTTSGGILENASVLSFIGGPALAITGIASGALLFLPAGMALFGVSFLLFNYDEKRKASQARTNAINALIQSVENDAREIILALPEREIAIGKMLQGIRDKSLQSRQ
jgi:hypothetical protein